MIFHTKEEKSQIENKTMYQVLVEAKENNKQIMNMAPKIEDTELKQNIKEINDSVTKIINTLERKPEKYDKMSNFFTYYLPITLNILKKYDEIENQSLNSVDSEKFMKQTKDMIKKINVAFKNQLANLYQSDIVDTDAEMKVFESMLRADGYDTSSDFNFGKEQKKDNEK